MDTRNKTMTGSTLAAQVMIPDLRHEIDLDGKELLRLEVAQPGTRVVCTAGTLWLTQAGDPQDYLIRAGESFTFFQAGLALVQGLPCGKARIVELGKDAFVFDKMPCAAAG